MSWLRLDDDMLDHPKWVRAIRDGGSGALHLWVALCSWCSRHLTDGDVPGDMVEAIAGSMRRRDVEKALRALETSQLIARLEPHGDHTATTPQPSGDHTATIQRPHGVRIVDYLERNPSRAETMERRDRQARHQRNHVVKRKLSAQHSLYESTQREHTELLPSRPDPGPIPAPMGEGARAPTPAPAECARRTISMPSKEPPKSYLDDAVMRGISPEQAQSTWEHYWGAGLPAQGVERLHDWLLKRAKERANSRARAGPTVRSSERGDVMAMMAGELEQQRAEEAARRSGGKGL